MRSTSTAPAPLDFTRDGKRSTWVDIPAGRGRAAVRLPITVVRRGDGPAVLFTGGNHGDEYEGPVALMKLIRSLQAGDLVSGTVVVMPVLNPPAVAAGTRTSPIDGKNLNREFPGRADGTVTERIAHFVTTAVLPHVDTVYDLHAGGVAMSFIPSVMIHRHRDPEVMDRTLAAMRAFRAPAGILIKEFDSEGMLDTTVERMGKVFACCELGGAGMLTPETVAVTETGVRNLLIHLGLVRGRPRTAAWRGQRRPREYEALSFRRYTRAKVGGLFEPLVDVAARVERGQPIGCIHDPHTPDRAAKVYRAPDDGTVFKRRAFGLVAPGDMLALVARELDAGLIIHGGANIPP